jgi:hypothetical protein
MLKFKKFIVCRFVHRREHVNDKLPCGERFFSPHGKFNDIDAKHKQKSAILPVQDTAYDNLFIF